MHGYPPIAYNFFHAPHTLFTFVYKLYVSCFTETFWHNPQYRITLVDPDEDDADNKCTVIVGLMQKNRRKQRKMGAECLTIGFAMYQVS